MKEFKRSVGGSFFKEKNSDKVSDISLLEDIKARAGTEMGVALLNRDNKI
tara:strand:- start:2022 stop:2171 length:150 start_codon:yes stop_codon:yes gene_type:complete